MRLASILVLSAILISGCSTLDNNARLSVTADGATTVFGIATGVAKEGNPLLQHPAAMAVSIVGRAVAINRMDKLDEPDRTNALAAFNSITWGVAAHNIGVIVASANQVGIAVGLATMLAVWQSTEMQRTHAAVCSVHKDEEACKPKR